MSGLVVLVGREKARGSSRSWSMVFEEVFVVRRMMVKRKVRRVLLLQHYIPEDKECVIHWNAVCWS